MTQHFNDHFELVKALSNLFILAPLKYPSEVKRQIRIAPQSPRNRKPCVALRKNESELEPRVPSARSTVSECRRTNVPGRNIAAARLKSAKSIVHRRERRRAFASR